MGFHLDMLEAGAPRSEVLLSIVRSDEYLDHAGAQVDLRPDASDEVFLTSAYQTLLHRDPDPEGLSFYQRLLKEGAERGGVVRALLGSDEHVNRVTAGLYHLPSLRRSWPDRYVEARSRAGGSVLAFHAPTPDWFDRLEAAILSSDYYDKPGIWEFTLNRDKRLMAEIVGALEPTCVLEIGCSNGTVLRCLHERGIEVTGLDISASAVARADPSIRDSIRVGDLLTARLPKTYDVVFGLDVFEHLNPNKLGACLSQVRKLTNPGGYVLTNLPAFGDDPVFGTVFAIDLEEWGRDAAARRPFSLLPVDEDGYPFHGHLVWADSAWWVRQFEGAGLRRQPAIERALHQRYDEYMKRNSPGRRSFYVFSRDADVDAAASLAHRIGRTGSVVLGREWNQAPAD